MIMTAFNSLPGRALRIVAGFAVSLWGFTFGVPAALFVQTVGVTLAVFALADICVVRDLGLGRRASAITTREKHA